MSCVNDAMSSKPNMEPEPFRVCMARCLPSGSSLTDADRCRVADIVRSRIVGRAGAIRKRPPRVVSRIAAKMLGDKTKGGFYKKVKGDGKDDRLALDWKTLEYKPAQKPKFPSLEMAKNIERHLRSLGSRPDGEIRSRLKKLVRKEIKDVESLSPYVERMREQYGQ